MIINSEMKIMLIIKEMYLWGKKRSSSSHMQCNSMHFWHPLGYVLSDWMAFKINFMHLCLNQLKWFKSVYCVNMKCCAVYHVHLIWSCPFLSSSGGLEELSVARRLPKAYSTGFIGCVKDMIVDGVQLHLVEDALNSPKILHCSAK